MFEAILGNFNLKKKKKKKKNLNDFYVSKLIKYLSQNKKVFESK